MDFDTSVNSDFTELLSYLPSCLFLQRRSSFTSRKLYTSLSSKILIFLSAIWSMLCFSSLMYETIWFKCNCWHTIFVRLSQDHGFDSPCGSHQLPVFLKYSVRLTLLPYKLVHLWECKTFAAWHKPFVTANDNLFKIIKFTLTSSVWNFRWWIADVLHAKHHSGRERRRTAVFAG